MKYRIEGNHIEMYFDKIPDTRIRESLKICGWRWILNKKCWSIYYSEENLIWAKKMYEEMNPAPESQLLQLNRCKVDMVDLVVRGNGFYCNKNHNVKDIAAEINVISQDGMIINCLVPAAYCEVCNTYFVLESIYVALKKRGIIKAKVMSYNRYKNGDRGSNMTGAWKEISILKELGYTVSEEEGYTSKQRQGILVDIIEHGILTRDKVLSYLDFFVKMHENGTSAVDKWKEDRTVIANYRIGSLKRVVANNIVIIE